VGMWASRDEIAALPRPTERFEPRMGADERRERYQGWQDAVARTVFRPGRRAPDDPPA